MADDPTVRKRFRLDADDPADQAIIEYLDSMPSRKRNEWIRQALITRILIEDGSIREVSRRSRDSLKQSKKTQKKSPRRTKQSPHKQAEQESKPQQGPRDNPESQVGEQVLAGPQNRPVSQGDDFDTQEPTVSEPQQKEPEAGITDVDMSKTEADMADNPDLMAALAGGGTVDTPSETIAEKNDANERPIDDDVDLSHLAGMFGGTG